MPCELVEGFKIHSKFSISFPKSKEVFSKFLHYNFSFKIFLSNALRTGSKINIIERGGGLPWKSMHFSFEEKIFNKKFTWAKKHKNKSKTIFKFFNKK